MGKTQTRETKVSSQNLKALFPKIPKQPFHMKFHALFSLKKKKSSDNMFCGEKRKISVISGWNKKTEPYQDHLSYFSFKKKKIVDTHKKHLAEALALSTHNTVEPLWLEHLWDQGNLFEIRVVEPLRVNHGARSGSTWWQFWGKLMIFYPIIVCWVYSLELPWWGNSNEYTHTIVECTH